jgi:hypothetical protein
MSNYSYINTRDQALSKGDDRKICNKNCDEACTELRKGGENFMQ